ncbi:hypothetical protein R3I93_017369 [Phoxinus phoxinus]|uniref:Ig-like domain-containing protein n=1 Tax=Phoxinus phoxinus TaxID=58324 RepID=A0AAN9GY59_9TELE
MKIIQLQIYLFMLYQATESLTNTPVTLGSDVIINCDLDIKEIYWFKQKLPDPPVLILRTYSSRYEGPKNENSNSKHKYSVKTNSRLSITNITIDELGVYYCVKTSEPLKFSNGTEIYISEFVDRNQTSESESHDAPQRQKSWINLIIIIITSVLLSASVIIAVIGLVKRCSNSTCKESNSGDVNETQFAESVLLKLLGVKQVLSDRVQLLSSTVNNRRRRIYRTIRQSQ